MMSLEQELESVSDSRAESESGFEHYDDELLENLEEIFALEEAEEGPDGKVWVQRLLQKAMCVLYMVLEVCDTVTKAAWSAHQYKRYKWRLNKEAAWLRGIYMES
jgi:hypothetical protein